ELISCANSQTTANDTRTSVERATVFTTAYAIVSVIETEPPVRVGDTSAISTYAYGRINNICVQIRT
ncbi:hypothetical protein, partial [Staphylococcus aureus]